MKIVITDAMTVTQGDVDIDIFAKYGELIKYDNTLPHEVAERVADADIAICNKTLFPREVLEQTKNLKLICLFATGYNNIDVAYCREHGITVCNAGSYSTDAVAQHTFALILEHYSKVGKFDSFVREGGWSASPMFSPFVFPTDEIAGKTIGIIGYGSIGRKVAEIAKAFGMKVVVYTRTVKDNDAEYLPLDELLSVSDIITMHCPLNEGTAKLMTYERFCLCKPSAVYINTARGGVNDEEGLVRALREGKISGAAIDVLTTEPQTKDCVLNETVPNLIITPHVAWAPLSTRIRLLGIVDDNVKCFLEGNPKNVVS
ncbi:MAG: D-2-hydroxyacid dehydrogenase [Clostridia bacterium]|nr:D-2-hydroxyacid dehydrogenase [Clostridia bacterium]